MSINDATRFDWDRLRNAHPPLELEVVTGDALALKKQAEHRKKLKEKWSRWCVTDEEINDMMPDVVAVKEVPVHRETVLPKDSLERKNIPVYTGFFKYFPRGIAAVAKLSLAGGLQHGQTPETLNWDRDKSGDELDALMRHILDGDWDQVAWRAMANLEKQLEKGFVSDCQVK